MLPGYGWTRVLFDAGPIDRIDETGRYSSDSHGLQAYPSPPRWCSRVAAVPVTPGELMRLGIKVFSRPNSVRIAPRSCSPHRPVVP